MFKVNDKVKVKKFNEEQLLIERNKRPNFVPEMDCLMGKMVTVTSVRTFVRIRESVCNWHPDWLEKPLTYIEATIVQSR